MDYAELIALQEKMLESRKDGGPGSGNHGHRGVIGERGGSAPSGIVNVEDKWFPSADSNRKDPNQGWNKERRAFLESGGFDGKKVSELERIIGEHIHGNNVNEEMQNFIDDNTELVMAVASYEYKAYEKRKEFAIEKAQKEITEKEKEHEELKEDIESGRMSWYSSDPKELERLLDDSQENIDYAKEVENKLQEQKTLELYRKGDYKDCVLSFTTDLNGVTLNAGTGNETTLSPDHHNSLEELMAQGIFPIGGIGAYYNFYAGEGSEVTCVKIQKQKADSRWDSAVCYMDGGPGSGNFGHKGVKGQVGGSAPAGSAKSPHEMKAKMRMTHGQIVYEQKDYDHFASVAYESTKGLFKRKSKWTGVIKNDNEACDLEDLDGYVDEYGNIIVRDTADFGTVLHEMMHTYSASHEPEEYSTCWRLEEGSVDYITSQICKANGIKYISTYGREMEAIEIVSKAISQRDEFGFAVQMMNQQMSQRGSWIIDSIKAASTSDIITETQRNELITLCGERLRI